MLGLFEHCWFIHSFVHSDIDVLQGSVATRVRCGGIYNNNFIADIIGNITLNFFENRLKSWVRCLPFYGTRANFDAKRIAKNCRIFLTYNYH